MNTTSSAARRVRFGPFTVDMRLGEMRKNDRKVRLQDQPFQVLAMLLESPGNLVTREELRMRLWEHNTFVDFDHGLNAAMNRLRERLGDDAEKPTYIETLPRRGYRFLAPVEVVEAVGPTADALEIAPQSPAIPGVVRRGGHPRLNLFGGAFSAIMLAALILLLVRASNSIPRLFSSPAATVIRSVAVLPLQNLSGNPADDYLADGMTEEIIGRLSAIHDLRVISRTSVMRFKETQLSIPEIAKKLGVDAVVEGSVIREGSRIRVHAQLIRAATDEHLWSESYDRELQDMLAVESDVAESIVQKVDVTVSGQERSTVVTVRDVSPEVYESYLQGQFALNKGTRADVEQSIHYFEQAINADPKFAPSYVGLAAAYDKLGLVFVGAPPSDTRPKVISAAEKALELDPQLADAHALLANTYRKEWKWTEAEAEYKRALELSPNDAAADAGFAEWLLCKGRAAEAVDWATRARELDPLDSSSNLAWILFQARRYDEAARELHAALAVAPDDPPALWDLGFVLVAEGKPGDAIPVLKKALSLSHGSPGGKGVLVRAYANAGERKHALRVLDELERQRQTEYVPAAALVQAYVGLGDKEQAFAWLEQAYKEQSNLMQFIGTEPTFDTLRSDPRFTDLVHRVGLE